MAAVYFAFGDLGFQRDHPKAASLRKQLVDNAAVLENESYRGCVWNTKRPRGRELFVPCMSLRGWLPSRTVVVAWHSGGLAQSVSFTLPEFVSSNADFFDEYLFKGGLAAPPPPSPPPSANPGPAGQEEYACLEFVGFSGAPKNPRCLPTRLWSCRCRERTLLACTRIHVPPLPVERGPVVRALFTKALLDSAMKAAGVERHPRPRVNVVFKARAYLLGYSDEYGEKGVVHDLNRFLLHTLRARRPPRREEEVQACGGA
eukprot:jgi/Picre1/34415/NNA_001884.t1